MTALKTRNTISCSAMLMMHIRRDLLNSVNAMLLPHSLISLSNEALLQVILYGHEQLSFDSNATILQATLEYIHASNVLNKLEITTLISR